MNEWQQTYLLAHIAGLPADPQVLLTASNAFQNIPAKALMQMQAYLLCLWAQITSSENFLSLEDGTPLLLEDGTNLLLE